MKFASAPRCPLGMVLVAVVGGLDDCACSVPHFCEVSSSRVILEIPHVTSSSCGKLLMVAPGVGDCNWPVSCFHDTLSPRVILKIP